MRHTSIICPVCKELTEVVDKALVDHGPDCPGSGYRYIPSPQRFSTGAGGPSFEVLGWRPTEVSCGSCGETHRAAEILARVHVPRPENN